MQDLPSSPKAAKAVNSPHYFTGRPCKRGHISLRYTSTAQCKDCIDGHNKQWRDENQERANELAREYYHRNRDKCLDKNKLFRTENPEYFVEYGRNYRENNRETLNEKSREWRLSHKEQTKQNWEDYYAKNKDTLTVKRKLYYETNRDALLEKSKEYRVKNKEALSERDKIWRQNNRHIKTALERKRQAQKIQATPSWLTPEHHAEILAIYKEAARLTKETGIPHHVDHIVPLRSKVVCGLHVPWNLQILTATENLRKGNKV